MMVAKRNMSGWNQRSAAPVMMSLLIVAGAFLVTAAPVMAATTFVVNKIGDAADLNLANTKCDTSATAGNQCTLRAAIQEANDTPGADTINFKITSASKVIAPATPLPPITGAVTINGYSQSGASANTQATGNNAVLKIVLDGVNAGVEAHGLEIQADGCVIRGLVVMRFDGRGILVSGENAEINGNFIGTDAAGTVARGNTVGLRIEDAGTLVGGSTPAKRNLISGNEAYGLEIVDAEATGNLVQGNYIGTNKAGTGQLKNGSHGVIVINGPSNTIGGTSAGERNVISGNGDDGVMLLGPVGGNVIKGNYIGTNAAGTAALGNEDYGIQLYESLNPVIGGTTPGSRNVISGNAYAGVEFAYVEGGTLQGNLIGTKADGTGDLGNGRDGVFVLAPDVVIGGPGSAANVISGNAGNGVWIQNSTYTGNQIVGNVIRLNDLSGVNVGSDATLVQGNVILQNGADGVLVLSNAEGARVTANQIFGSGELGIDLAGGTENAAGVTANDSGDPDTGANNRQNFPLLNTATRSNANGVTTVSGTLNSNASTQYRIELFMAVADGSGHGEGQSLLAAQNITTNASGNKGFSFVGIWPQGMVLTATATSVTAGNTSEFSANRAVVAGL